MPVPSLAVFVAFDSPFSGTLPDDLSPYAKKVSIRRGRRSVFHEVEAGEATLTLLNTDRRFDPDNTSSPHVGDILPMRPISIGATYDGNTYWLFTGYVTAWQPRYQGGNLAYVDLLCVDGFEPLSRLWLGTEATPATFSAGNSEDRVIAVLDHVGWPGSGGTTGARDIDTAADMALQASELVDVPALEYLQLIARSENGLFFVDREGKAAYQSRTFRSTATSVTTIAPFGDAANDSELAYAELQTSFDVSQIWNRIEMQAEEGVLQVSEDATSKTAYLTRVYARTDLLNSSDTDVGDIADEILAQYKDPKTRARRMTIDPYVVRAEDVWPIVLEGDLSTKLDVKRAGILGGSVLNLDCFIEGIQHDIEPPARWRVTWDLSSI